MYCNQYIMMIYYQCKEKEAYKNQTKKENKKRQSLRPGKL